MSVTQIPYKKISVSEGIELFEKGDAVVVDVRSAKEYNASHIPNSVWIPVGEIAERQGELPQSGKLLFICRTGIRSSLAAEYVATAGADPQRLYSVVKHGVKEWLTAAQTDKAQV